MNENEHSDLLKRLDSLNLDVPPVPGDFHAGWVSRLEDDMETRPKKFTKQTLTRVLSVAAALVFIIGGTTLAQRAQKRGDVDAAAGQVMMARSTSMDAGAYLMDVVEYEEDYDDSVAERGMLNNASAAAKAVTERMMVRTASLTIGTQAYDKSLAALTGMCEEAGGWTASVSENVAGSGLRTCYLTLRVPAEQLDWFLSGTGGLGRVTHRSESAEDVTESYYDTKGRLATQEALMERLQKLVTGAASLSELLELEVQIADTQYQIDRLQSQLNTTERRVNYADVDVTLREESAASDITDGEKSLGQRLLSALKSGGEAFVDLMESAAVFLAAALPFIAIVAVIWVAVMIIRKRIRKGR